MSATELIRQLAALPSDERRRFEQLFEAMKNGGAPQPPKQTSWPDFGERLRAIYGDRIAPDSQSIIDEGRGRQALAKETGLAVKS